jgi:hypothetical protein
MFLAKFHIIWPSGFRGKVVKNSFKKPKSAELKINSLHGWWPS